MLPPLGIAVAREGIPWPLVDRGGGELRLLAVRRLSGGAAAPWSCRSGTCATTAIRTVSIPCRRRRFVERFAAYARAAARYVADRAHHGPLCFTPMNEPTFWGYMGGEWAWCAPFGTTPTTAAASPSLSPGPISRRARRSGQDFPDARLVHIDPLIWVVPPRDRPDLAEAARRESYEDAYLPGT